MSAATGVHCSKWTANVSTQTRLQENDSNDCKEKEKKTPITGKLFDKMSKRNATAAKAISKRNALAPKQRNITYQCQARL